MTARHRRPPAPRRRIAAWNAAANRIPEAARWGLGVVAVVLCVAGTVGAAHSVAPQVAAQQSLSFPEQVAEPTARGGRLVIPSIGVVAESTQPVALSAPSTIRSTTRTPSAGSRAVLSQSVAIAEPSETSVVIPSTPKDPPPAPTTTTAPAPTGTSYPPPTTTSPSPSECFDVGGLPVECFPEETATATPEPTETTAPTTESGPVE